MIKQNKIKIIVSSIVTLLPMVLGFVIWDKLAGKLWIIGGILMIAAGIFKITTLFVIVIFIVVSVPVVYSYLLYRNKRI